MITYSNIKRLDNIPFNDYLKLDGYSHSFLKREHNGITSELAITENILTGKLVDAILTDPATADMSSPLYGKAKIIAHDIREAFAGIIHRFEKQVSFTCEMEHRGFTMPSKMRLDFLLPAHAVIDLKFTKSKPEQIPTLIEHFGYKNQVWHYCKGAGVKMGYLMIYSEPARRTLLYMVDPAAPTNPFWEEKILLFGRVAA